MGLGALLVVRPMMPNGGSELSPAAPVAEVSATGRFVDGTYESTAGTRRWRLWVPRGFDAARRHPLLVLLHGCTQDPDDIARGTRIADHADRETVLVLLPEQPETANARKCWNWYEPAHQQRDGGEPALIAGMTRQVIQDWSVDVRRVHVAGISAGAAMASIVAIAYPDVFASVGMHSGIPYRAAANVMEGLQVMANGAPDVQRLARLARDVMGPRARPIPAIIVQGEGDPVVRPVNAIHTRDAWLAMNDLARGNDGRLPTPDPLPRNANTAGNLAFVRECFGARESNGECEVVTLSVSGLGHAWSGGSTLGTFTDVRGPDATFEILRFLLAHPMPAPGPTPGATRP